MGSDHVKYLLPSVAGWGRAKYLELLQNGSKNALIRALYRIFQEQKGHWPLTQNDRV